MLIISGLSVRAEQSVLAPPVVGEPFKIGVVDDNPTDSLVGLSIMEGIKQGDKTIELLKSGNGVIPDDISALLIAKKHLGNNFIKQLFDSAKKQRKPIYIYGDGLGFNVIESNLNINTGIELHFEKQENIKKSVDLVGFKFEGGDIMPSFVLSIYSSIDNRPLYDLDGLKKHIKYYNIKIQRKNQISNVLLGIANAAGMNVRLPASFSKIYTWEATIYNWIQVNSGAYKRASTYHIYEVYKDPTINDPDFKSYAVFRLDAVHLDTFDRYFSKNTIMGKSAGIITKNYEPDNSSFNGTTTINLAWPLSASITFSSGNAIEVYNSTIDFVNDSHYFYVEDDEWFDTLLRPGDCWVANLSYEVPEADTYHEFAQYVSHQKEGIWGVTAPSEYYTSSKRFDRSYGNTVIWRIER